MGWIYSNGLGMHEIGDDGADTPEDAMIEYYKRQKQDIERKIQNTKEILLARERCLAKLDEEFKHVIEKYPEKLL